MAQEAEGFETAKEGEVQKWESPFAQMLNGTKIRDLGSLITF